MNLTERINNFYYHMSLYELQLMNGNDYYNGLSYNSLLYINVIDQTEDCTVSRLADALHITKSAVTIKINELVKQNIVRKEQSLTDKRVYFLRLSPDMNHTLGIYDEIFEKIGIDLRKKYTENQLELFGDILQTISGYKWRSLKNEQRTES